MFTTGRIREREDLKYVARTLARQAELSQHTLRSLVESSSTINSTDEEFNHFTGLLNQSKVILSKYGRREVTDRCSVVRRRILNLKVPSLDEKDLEERFISGSGPGGQSVNKAVNCCQLRHKPTGLIVKVHQTRSLEQNRKIARQLMIQRLDNLYNGEDSVENQKKRIALSKLAMKEAERQRLQTLKKEYKDKFGTKEREE